MGFFSSKKKTFPEISIRHLEEEIEDRDLILHVHPFYQVFFGNFPVLNLSKQEKIQLESGESRDYIDIKIKRHIEDIQFFDDETKKGMYVRAYQLFCERETMKEFNKKEKNYITILPQNHNIRCSNVPEFYRIMNEITGKNPNCYFLESDDVDFSIIPKKDRHFFSEKNITAFGEYVGRCLSFVSYSALNEDYDSGNIFFLKKGSVINPVDLKKERKIQHLIKNNFERRWVLNLENELDFESNLDMNIEIDNLTNNLLEAKPMKESGFLGFLF